MINNKLLLRLVTSVILLPCFLLVFIVFTPASAIGQKDSLRRPSKITLPVYQIPYETDDNGTSCSNSNFAAASFINWTGCYGLWCNDPAASTRCAGGGAYIPFNPPCNPPGTSWTNVPSGGHFAIESAGMDPCIATLSKVFTGETHSALIGSRACSNGQGGYADQLTYPLIYDPANSFFIYRCAVVLANISDGTHNTADKRPRFTFEIRDHATAAVIDSTCGFYDLWPGDGVTTWNTGPNLYVWKDWSTIGIDLSGLPGITSGQLLDAVFTVHGCAFTAHTGYAYVSATCGSMNIAIAGCEGTGTVIMTAPPGFVEYEWRGPGLTGPVVGNGQTCTIVGAVTGDVYYLNLTALNGCEVTNVAQTIAFTSVIAAFTPTINCVGNASSFNDISTSSNPDQPIQQRTWDFGDGTPLVGPTTANPVAHTYTAAGTYTVTLISYSKDGCEGTTSQPVTVGPPPAITNLPAGLEICSGDNLGVNLEFSQTGATANWSYTITTGTATVAKNPLSQSGVLINDTIVNTGTGDAVVTYTIRPRIGDCIAASVDLPVTVHLRPEPDITGTDTVCAGTTGVTYTTEALKTGYIWTVSAGGIITAGTGTEAITVDWNTAGTQSVSVNYTDANNCDALEPEDFEVTVNPLPTAALAGTTSVCVGDAAPNITFTGASGTAPYTFTYTINAGAPQTISTTVGNSVTVAQPTAVAGTYIYAIVSVADDNTCSQNQTGSATITVNPVPDVNAISGQVLCHNTETTDVAFTGSVTGTVYNWINSDPSIGLAASGTGDITAFTVTNATSAPVVATITVTPTFTNLGTTCTGTSTFFTVTVNPSGQVNDPADQVVCNSAPASVTFSTTHTGGTTTYSWINDTPAIGLAAGGTGNIASFTALNTGTSPVVATLTVTPTFSNGSASCDGPAQTFTITVNPSGQVNDPADQVVCNNAPAAVTFTTTHTGGTTTYSWINDTPAIGLAAAGTGDIASFTALNTGTSPVMATITVTPSFTNGSVSCAGPAQTFTITVNPSGQVNDPADQVVCNNAPAAVTFTTTHTGGTTTYSWINDTPAIGLAAGGTGDIASFTALNTGTSPVVATLTVTPTFSNGSVSCDGPAQTFTITVNPTAQVNDPSDQVVCNNAPAAVTFSTTHTGGTTTYIWINDTPAIGLAASGTGDIASFTALNPGTSPIVATITVTPTFTNGSVSCAGPPESFTITVNPSGQVNDPADQVVCNNAPAGVTFTTTHTGGTTTYSWINDTPAIGLAAGGTGDIASFTALNPGTSPVVATLTVTPTFTNGSVNCDGPAQTFTITVNPSGQVNDPADQVVCNNAPAAVTFSTTHTGGTTTYSWTNDTPAIGLAAGGTGDIASFTALNPGTLPVMATITVTPTFTNGSVSCEGPAQTFTITVNPSGQVNDPADQVVCNNTPAAVTFSTTHTGGTTTYSWINDTPAIGLAGGGTGDIASFTALNPGTSPVVATITVTPTFTNGSVSCAGTAQTFTITVNPSGQVNDPTDQVVCNNAPAAVTFSTTHTGGTTTYSWINDTPAIGLAASGTGDIASFTALNPGTSPIVATITVTPTFTNGSVSCDGPALTFTITVNPTAQVNDPSDQVVCNNAPAAVTFSTTHTGGTTTYSWINDTPAIGLAAGGTGDIASFTALNPGTSPVVATITVTPTFTNGSVSCAGLAQTFTITVNPSGQVNDPANQVVCNNAPAAVTFSTTHTGGITTYIWTNDTPAIGLAGGGTGDIASFTALNPGTSPVVATLTVTPTFTNGSVSCPGPAQTFTITVNPSGQVNDPADQVVCNNAPTAVTFSTTHTGGTTTYSWINDTPAIGLAAGGTGDITSFTALNPGTSPVVATITVTPTFTNGSVSCTGPAQTFTITVNPSGQVNDPANQVVCNNAPAAVTFTTTHTGGTTTYIWINDTPTIGLAGGGTGDIASFTALNPGTLPVVATITVTPTFTNGSVSCEGPAQTFTITVNPSGQVNDPSDQVLCHGTPTSVTFGTISTGGTTTYNWVNDNTTIGLAASGTGNIALFLVTNVTNAPVVAIITVTPTFTNGSVSCAGPSQTFTITVNPIPTVNAVNNQTLCNAAPSTLVTFSGNVAGTVYNWINNNTTIGLAAGGSGDIASFTATNSTNAPVTATITVTPSFTNTGNTCTGLPTSFTITVNPKPSVILPASPPNPQEVCSGSISLAVPLSSSVSIPGVTYSWTAIAYDPVNPTINISGFTTPNSGNAIPAENIVSSLLTQGVIKYTVTAAFNSPGLVCPGDPVLYQTLVNPSPTVALTPSDPIGQAICSGQTSLPITFVPNVTPTIYTWQAIETVGVLGSIPSGTTDNIPAQLLILSGPAQGHVKYQVTPVYQGGGSFICPGGVSYSTIFVNPLPAPVISGPTLTCELGPDATYSTPGIAGHSYLWTVTGGTITSAANINQITVSWGSSAGSPGTLTVVETIDATACQITTPAYQVTLQQRPIPTLTGPLSVCIGSPGKLYVTESSMFQYNWQISGGTITSGGTPGSSTATVTWTNPGAGNWIEVNYQNALGCPGFPAKRINVQVNPLPVTTITSTAGPDCNLQSHVYQTPLDIACTYTWSATPGNVVAGQGSNSATISWLAAGPATVFVTGTYSGTTGCTSSSSFPTTVYPSPTPTFNACFDVVTTQNAKPILLKGGLPLGGQYQGSPAISFDIISGRYWFNPASALIMPGMHPITYHSQNSFGCANTSTPVSITVLPSNATFTCNTTFTDPRDGKSYQTAMLGSQCWMKENLDFGITINELTHQTDNCIPEKYVNIVSPVTRHAFFQWNELMQYNDDLTATRQGFCPPGWHVPSSTEWQNMIDSYQGNGIAGGALKDMGTTQAFHAVLNGIGYLNNMWAFTNIDLPNASLYWTSTLSGNKPVARGLNSINPSVSIYESSSANAFSVRCVKD